MRAARIVPAEKEWAYEQMGREWLSNNPAWIEVSHDFYWQALEVLPPIYVPGGFMVSEAWRHDDEDRPVYAGFCEYQGRYYARYSGRRVFGTLIATLRAQIDADTAAPVPGYPGDKPADMDWSDWYAINNID